MLMHIISIITLLLTARYSLSGNDPLKVIALVSTGLFVLITIHTIGIINRRQED